MFGILYVSTFLHVVLALYVFLKKPKNFIHVYFSLFAIFIALWSYSNIAFLNSANEDIMSIWTAIAYNAGSLMLYFMYLFSISISEVEINKSKFKINLLLVLLSVFIVYIPNFVFKGVDFNNKSIITNFGVGLVFLSYIYFIYLSLSAIFKKQKLFKGIKKVQLRIIFVGLLLAIIFGLLFNVVFPTLQIYKYVALGPSFSLILLSVITYNILKYQLFDIRLLFGKITYYITASIPPYAIYFFLAFIYEKNFGTSFNSYAYVIGVPAALTFTIFVNSFSKIISEYTDTHLINPGYNPLVVLEQHRKRLASTLDIEKINQESLFIIARTIRPLTSGVVLLLKNNGSDFYSVNYKSEPFENPQDINTIIEIIRKQNLKYLYTNENNAESKEKTFDQITAKYIKNITEKYKTELFIPLRDEQKINGVLLVGFKESKVPYSNQEIKLLLDIGETMSLAIGRALLYQEIQQFNLTLQQKVTDATEQLQVKNKTLEETLLKLEEIRRQEKDMLDVMGHELRTPISIARNAIVTLHKHVENNDIDQEKLHKYTKMAVESIRREIALVETFLSTTKLEGKRMQINLEPISLLEVIDEAINGHKDLAVKNNTELIFNKPENDITVSADKIRIQEIIDNFVNNAIKYTGEGKVEIRVYENEGLGWIDVQDTGIGISQENIEKLGRKFFRVQKLYNPGQTTVNPSGTGLGLFVSFQLIEMMNGKRKITSKEGEGTTFSFGLPLIQS